MDHTAVISRPCAKASACLALSIIRCPAVGFFTFNVDSCFFRYALANSATMVFRVRRSPSVRSVFSFFANVPCKTL
jgi:hypothetical protein